MKKFLVILGIIGFLFASIPLPVFAWSEEDPFEIPVSEESTQYFMKFYIVYETSATTSTKNVHYKYGYIYSDYQDVYFDINAVAENIHMRPYTGNPNGSLRKYINGVSLETTLATKQLFPAVTWVNSQSFTKEQLKTMLLAGYIEDYRTQYSNLLNYELTILEGNINAYDYATDELIFDSSYFSLEPEKTENPYGYITITNVEPAKYNIQTKTFTTLSDSPTVTIKYFYEPNQYEYDSSDWVMDFDRTPNLWLGSGTPSKTVVQSSIFPGMYEVTEKYKILGLTDEVEIQLFLYTNDSELFYSSDIFYIEKVVAVDANNDGIDDNTGMIIPPVGTPPPYVPDTTIPDRMDFGEGLLGNIDYTMSLIKYYITMPFVWLSDTLTDLTEWLNTSMGWISQLSAFFGAIFGFLPPEIVALLYVMLLITVIFSTFKLMRG